MSDNYKKPAQGELAYMDYSPNYCERNVQKRIPGTMERVCNKTSNGEDSCELLCCGRGYNTHEFVRKYRCHCKFHWCCSVKCKKCKERLEVFKCKWEFLHKILQKVFLVSLKLMLLFITRNLVCDHSRLFVFSQWFCQTWLKRNQPAEELKSWRQSIVKKINFHKS